MDAVRVTARASGSGLWPVGSFTAASVAPLKGTHRVSVVVPAKDEVATVAGVVATVLASHGRKGGSGLVDEVLVVDDGSGDGTARAARAEGARVRRLPTSVGKGRAMVEGALSARGDLVVYLDADVLDTSPDWIPQLVGPLLLDERIELVKGYYTRPLEGRPTGGGRVTELTARPALSLLFPELGEVRQPLAGETALRRSTALALGIERGYGAELGLLIDVARQFGADAIAQVDLGTRTHRNRPIEELGAMSRDVLRVALQRAGVATA